MKQWIIIILLLLLFCQNKIIAQDKCPPINLYKTNFVGDGKDSSRLSLPLNFVITTDSIIISLDNRGKNIFAAFRIINKECFWNKDFSEGKSVYKLMLGDIRGNKYPTLTITSEKNKINSIELLYENAEKRIFSSL